MRYLAIHFSGYGPQGVAAPAFELEANDPTSPPTRVFPIPGAAKEIFRAAQEEMQFAPPESAGLIAVLTGGQSSGVLAEKDSGMVVFTSKGLLSEEDQFPWHELNPESYWLGEATTAEEEITEPDPEDLEPFPHQDEADKYRTD